jgi:hypothetical protein
MPFGKNAYLCVAKHKITGIMKILTDVGFPKKVRSPYHLLWLLYIRGAHKNGHVIKEYGGVELNTLFVSKITLNGLGFIYRSIGFIAMFLTGFLTLAFSIIAAFK